jgi:predicted mannosyl-3-phosphoglycerate phosphatase (HAD superfamily)
MQVLRESGRSLRMIEVHQAVEELLGEPVPRSSVKNYLASGAGRHNTPVFERVSYGRYRLHGQ